MKRSANLRNQQVYNGTRREGNTHRCGFSLIEVIVATAILMGSVVVLARLAGMGRTMVQKAQQHSAAQRICEQTLNEIMLGLRPLEQVDNAVLQPVGLLTSDLPATGDGAENNDLIAVRRETTAWTHSVFSRPLEDRPGLTLLSVSVQSSDDGTGRPLNYRLRRWVRVPGELSASADFAALPSGAR